MHRPSRNSYPQTDQNSKRKSHDRQHADAVGYRSVSHGWTAAEAFASHAKGEAASRRLWVRCDGHKRTALAAAAA